MGIKQPTDQKRHAPRRFFPGRSPRGTSAMRRSHAHSLRELLANAAIAASARSRKPRVPCRRCARLPTSTAGAPARAGRPEDAADARSAEKQTRKGHALGHAPAGVISVTCLRPENDVSSKRPDLWMLIPELPRPRPGLFLRLAEGQGDRLQFPPDR